MIKEEILRSSLEILLQRGADYADIYFEEEESKGVSVINERIQSNYSLTQGTTIRAIKDGKTYSVSFNDSSEKKILEKANNLLPFSITNKKEFKFNFRDIEKDNLTELIDIKTIGKKLVDINKKVKGKSNLITVSTSSINESQKIKQIATTKGRHVRFKQFWTKASFFARAENKNSTDSASKSYSKQVPLKYFLETFDFEDTINYISDLSVKLLNAEYIKGGKMPVVIGNGFGGVLFHESCGHLLETSTQKVYGETIYSNKIGKLVMSPLVTAYDDGTIVNECGYNKYDDEANKTQKNLLIEKGVLKNYLTDTESELRAGFKTNGSARKQSFIHVPVSRMSNTYIAAGDSTVEEIISSVEYGLYAKSFGGGQVNPANGEFNFGVNEGYLIKNGKIDKLIKGASLIGVGNEVMDKVVMVSNDVALGDGMCGSSSGTIPAAVGQPTLKISDILVGGK